MAGTRADGDVPSDLTGLADVPRQMARTQRLSLGVPRAFTVSDDGERVLFLRTGGGEDPVGRLYVLDVSGERLVVDPSTLVDDDVLVDMSALPPEELARRERVRESGGGIVSYSADRSGTAVVFTLGGSLWLARVDAGPTRLPTVGAPVDATIDPTGRRVAYVAAGTLRLLDLGAIDRPERAPGPSVDDEQQGGSQDRVLAAPESADVTYGLAEHVAAEEMHRDRGYWWAPDGEALLLARVDNATVTRWWISDPSDPSAAPRQFFYPVAGSKNADVSLFVSHLDGTRTEVRWDRVAFEYLATAGWDRHGPIISVQSRDQRTVRTLGVDPETGQTDLLAEDTDPLWVRLVAGSPARTDEGRLVTVSDRGDARRLVIDGAEVTADDVQVRQVLGVDGETVWFSASTEPTEIHIWRWTPADGPVRVTEEPGLHDATVGVGTAVQRTVTEERHAVSLTGRLTGTIGVHSAAPLVEPEVRWLSIGPRSLRAALILPRWYGKNAKASLPVLLSPYAGPALQLVTRARHFYFVEAQWFADNGFAVLIADGAGTPGRGPAWEREIYGDTLTPVIADQIAALVGVAERFEGLDLGRVAMRGWSFSGLLALACVLRHPDVFHAAIAGAAPTDMLLYDTHYRERYLGDPREHPEHYDRCSPVNEAGKLRRPLLMIHGLSDDNVAVANTLRMSTALLAAGRPHEVLLLPGATHMTRDPDVMANLLLHELDFLRRALGLSRGSGGDER